MKMRDYIREIVVLLALVLIWVGWWFWPAPPPASAPVETPETPVASPRSETRASVESPAPDPPADPVPPRAPGNAVSVPIRVVQAADGAPIESMYVTAVPYPEAWRSVEAYVSAFDDPHDVGERDLRPSWQELHSVEGEYSLRLDDGTPHWMILVQEDGYARQGRDLHLTRLPEEPLTFRLSPVPSLLVRMENTGTADAGCLDVTATAQSPGADAINVPLQYDVGRRAFHGTPPNRDAAIVIAIASPWFETHTITLPSYDEWKRGVCVELEPTPFAVRVTRDDWPVEGLAVCVEGTRGCPRSDSNGLCRFDYVRPAPAEKLRADPIKGGSQAGRPGPRIACADGPMEIEMLPTLPVHAGDRVDLSMDGDATLTCRILNAESLVPGVNSVRMQAFHQAYPQRWHLAKVTQEEGVFTWDNLPGGTWLVEAVLVAIIAQDGIAYGMVAETVLGCVEVAPGTATIAGLDVSQAGTLSLTRGRGRHNGPIWGYTIDVAADTVKGGIMPPVCWASDGVRLLPGRYTVYTTALTTDFQRVVDHETITVTAGSTTECSLALPKPPETNDAPNPPDARDLLSAGPPLRGPVQPYGMGN